MTKPIVPPHYLVKQHRLFYGHGSGHFYVWLDTKTTRLGLGTDHGFGRNNFLKAVLTGSGVTLTLAADHLLIWT